MATLTPFLWFDDQAEEAARFYASVFKGPRTKVLRVTRAPEGKAFLVAMRVNGQKLMLLNGGPRFPQTEAFSLYVSCKDQREVDRLWKRLTGGGGHESMCGWLKDKFGVSWQIVPDELPRLIGDKDPRKAAAATQAMLQMRKIDLKALRKAHAAA